jgi:primase-polymerase (primpol)-like protein
VSASDHFRQSKPIRQAKATSPTKAEIESSPQRPQALPVNPEGIPVELREYPQWVCWRYEWRVDKKGKGKWTKPLIDPKTGRLASSTVPKTWVTFSEAMDYFYDSDADGIGFVFSADDPFTGIDLDDCRDSATKELQAWARKIVDELGTYTEVSPSRTGVKLLLKGKVPPGGNRKDEIELYDRSRYFTITGHQLTNSPATVNERQKAIDKLHAQLFRPSASNVSAANLPTNTNPSCLSDEEIIRKAKAAKNGDKFGRLWAGDISAYASHSEGDLALCSLLAFWTGPDFNRIDRLFRESKLFRPKWEREDYRRGVISKALQERTEFYSPRSAAEEASRGGEWLLENEPAAGTKQNITVRVQGSPVHIDTFDPANANQRQRFLKALVEKLPQVNPKAIETQLLAIADKPRHDLDRDSGEVELSRIVRPEQFFTTEVSGLTVAAVHLRGGKPSARWNMYLTWADGRREIRELAGSIDLPDGKQLWVHPVPGNPTVTTVPGWSSLSRKNWLEGAESPEPADLFRRACSRVTHFVDLPPDTAEATTATVVLWSMLTYSFQAWDAVPYLFVGGPMGSGKSTLFGVLNRLVQRPLVSSNLTAPALFRTLHDRGEPCCLMRPSVCGNRPPISRRSCRCCSPATGGVAKQPGWNPSGIRSGPWPSTFMVRRPWRASAACPRSWRRGASPS